MSEEHCSFEEVDEIATLIRTCPMMATELALMPFERYSKLMLRVKARLRQITFAELERLAKQNSPSTPERVLDILIRRQLDVDDK